MDRNPADLLKRVLPIADEAIDPARVADAKRRQADMFAWRQTDSVPVIFGTGVPALNGLPDFDWAEQFADPAASLYMQMKDVICAAAAGGDVVPTVRADTGVINGPSILGAPYIVPAHTKPVCNGHVPKDRLAAFEVPDDITPLGAMPVMVEHTKHHLAALAEAGLADRIGVRHCDTQGPFDIAAQVYGHDAIFLDLYTDTDFVEALMEKCLDVYVKMSVLSKTLAGDSLSAGYANEYWMDPGSVRLCDDSGILVSPDQFRRFCAPYVERALAPFGGGWVHYCGGVPDGNRPEGLHLHDIYCGIGNLRGLQFTTGRDWPAEIRKVIERKVVYLGPLPRGDGEPLAVYFRRALSLCDGRCGMILNAAVQPAETDSAMDTWQKVQDDLFG